MSLATTGGGMGGVGAGGAGGIAMAHQANAVGIPPGGHHQQHTTANASSTGAAPPPSIALGADLFDKNQTGLSMKQVRNRQHLPIVAIDLYNSDGKASTAYFPRKPDDPSVGAPPLFVSNLSSDVIFHANNLTSHTTLRKYLSKSKTFSSLQNDSLASEISLTPVSNNKKGKPIENTSTTVSVKKPHHWLGLRRISDAPDFLRTAPDVYTPDTNLKLDSSALSHAIAEESRAGVGFTIEDSTLDGLSCPKNDDFDRVILKVRLHESKKAVTLLPEEAVQIIFSTAQHLVAEKIRSSTEEKSKKKTTKTKHEKDSATSFDDDEILDFPLVICLPAWDMHDATIEALMDATEGSGVFVPRSVAAAAGVLLPSLDGSITPLLARMNSVRAALQKQHQRALIDDPGAVFEDAVLLLLYGMTDVGFECTAIQISTVNQNNISCLFSEFKILSNVSLQSNDPISKMEQCSKELEAAIEAVAPESDGPTALVFYGNSDDQEKMKSQWKLIRTKQEEWSNVPEFVTPSDCVARGTAVMGAVAHGRLTKLSVAATSGKKKVKSLLGIRVQNVALAAVGISFNYHGDDRENCDTKWTPIKNIFDFDRQTPAGPHSFDLKAAECAVHREKGRDVTETMPDEEFLKLVAQFEGSKGIPAREAAALNLRVQVYEKWTRDGEWKKVGDPMEPLVIRTADPNSKNDDNEIRTGCEAMVLDLSLAVSGLIITALSGERTSVVVATKEARNSRIRWYLGMLFLILFCGGFLFKSWYDDYVLQRDTKRLLAFYKHVVPGSIHDGDFHGARYTCYKFRNKKAKLWKKLESKYGVPVLETHEYQSMTDTSKSSNAAHHHSDNEGTVDLDEEDNGEDNSQENDEL